MSTRRLPSGWSVVKLRDVAEIVRGVSYDKEAAADTPAENYVPLLRATNIKNDRLILEEDLVFVPKRYVDDEQVLKKWDVVVCMSSGSKHLVGKTGQLTTNWDGTFGTFCTVIRFRDIVNPRFAGRYFESQEYRHFISQQSSGVNINNLRARDLAELDFPLPPLFQQQEIVDAIETQFTRLDAAVAALKRVQANLRRYRAAVLKAACEGRLVPTEAELAQAEGRTYEPAATLLERILAERRAKWQAEHPGKKYKEPAGPDVSTLPELPEGWCWATVEQLGAIQLGRQRSPINHEGPYMRPYLRAGNVTWDGLDLSDVMEMNFVPEEFARYVLKSGDILLSEASGSADEVGKPIIWRNQIDGCCFQNTLIRVQTTHVSVEYLHLHLFKDARLGRLGQLAKGVGIHHLGAERLAQAPVAVPPLAEQMRIVDDVEQRLSVLNSQEIAVTTGLARANLLRQSILQRAFSGNLTAGQTGGAPLQLTFDL